MRHSVSRWFLLVTLHGAVGCDFGDAEYLVAHDDLPSAGNALAISADSSILWASNSAGPLSLRAFNATTGAPVTEFDPIAAWGIRDLSAAWEAGATDQVWVFHLNGYRTRWDTGGTIRDWAPPVDSALFPADSRVYCLFATSGDGAHFVTATDWVDGANTHYLYRYGTDGTWSRVEASGAGCAQVAYDEPLDEIAVLDYAGYVGFVPVVRWFDPDTLALTREQEITDAPAQSNDFAAFGYNTAFDGSGADIGLYDATGNLTDNTSLSSVKALSYRTTPVGPKLAWSGTDDNSAPEYAAGLFALLAENL